jgi:hypothetical protein
MAEGRARLAARQDSALRIKPLALRSRSTPRPAAGSPGQQRDGAERAAGHSARSAPGRSSGVRNLSGLLGSTKTSFVTGRMLIVGQVAASTGPSPTGGFSRAAVAVPQYVRVTKKRGQPFGSGM